MAETVSEQQYSKDQLIKKARKKGIAFSIDRGTHDDGLEIITCHKRFIKIDKRGNLLLNQEETTQLIWTLLMTFLGALVPAVMFLEEGLKIRIVAVAIFTMFQIGAIATVNAGRPEVRVFDKDRSLYRIKRANHIFTRLFRKTWLTKAKTDKVTGVTLSSFKAKRWHMRRMGSSDNRYTHQELKTYENYRLSLKMVDGKEVNIYDWYDLDHAIEIGEEVAKYLGTELNLEGESHE